MRFPLRHGLYVMALVFSLSAAAQTESRITYIANEGYFIESGGRSILVDALFGGFVGTWCDQPSDEIRSKLENAVAPFDRVDIVAISHYHQDHFNQAMVIRHAINNPHVVILCPEQVQQSLMKSPDYGRIARNILSCTPAVGKDTVVHVRDVSVRILRLEHGPYLETDTATGERVNRHRNVENIGFIFAVNGMKILHGGDANSRNRGLYEAYAQAFEDLDLAFLDRLFIYHERAEGVDIIEKIMKPHDVIVMHVEPGSFQKYRDIALSIGGRVPHVFVFTKPMESRVFSPAGD